MESKRLTASKYAPRTPAENLALKRASDLEQEKEKAARLLGRLRWKAESLTASYVRARDIVYAEIDQNGYLDRRGESRYPFVLGVTSKQSESMFKVDFFEFYTLLERYITLCLSVVGVFVSANAPRTNVNALRFLTNPEFAKTRAEASHQFHANLLEALDDPKNPLHPALGNQDVRIQLGLAKDYRNRWKDADEKLAVPQWAAEDDARRPIKLDELDLNIMLHTILVGCDYALSIVHDRQNDSANSFTSRDFEPNAYNGYNSLAADDQPLEYMEDPMDLD